MKAKKRYTPSPQPKWKSPIMSAERIISIHLDDSCNTSRTPEIEHEYKTATADLISKNYFHLCKNPGNDPVNRGPYELHLRILEGRLIMDMRLMKIQDDGSYIETIREKLTIPMTPFRSIIKDYFFICESYLESIRSSSSPSQVETIDMARRGLHNEGASVLKDLMTPNVEVDFETARRLFTLVCVLHIR
jgi:uncharacterized protein (UPF0262 family)